MQHNFPACYQFECTAVYSPRKLSFQPGFLAKLWFYQFSLECSHLPCLYFPMICVFQESGADNYDGCCRIAYAHADCGWSDQCAMCCLGSMFTSRPNKLRHILKFVFWYTIYLSQLVWLRGQYIFFHFCEFQTLNLKFPPYYSPCVQKLESKNHFPMGKKIIWKIMFSFQLNKLGQIYVKWYIRT